MITTYGELVAQVAKFLDRSDQDDQIPELISLAEQNIYRVIRCPANEIEVLVSPLTAGRFTIPPDFLEMRHLWVDVNPQIYLYPKPMDAIVNAQYSVQDTGYPKFWSRIGTDIMIWPYQSTVTDLKMIYYGEFAPLDDTPENETNPLFATAPDLWLYGTLLCAEPYLMNDARLTVWMQEYSQRMAAVQALRHASEIGGGPLQLEAAHYGY